MSELVKVVDNKLVISGFVGRSYYEDVDATSVNDIRVKVLGKARIKVRARGLWREYTVTPLSDVVLKVEWVSTYCG
jgi:hypothetical protein